MADSAGPERPQSKVRSSAEIGDDHRFDERHVCPFVL